MKLIGVKEFYNITRAKVISALNCAIVVAVCSTATFIVDSALDYNTVQAQPVATEVEVTVTVVSTPDETAPDETDPAETSATEITESSAETSPSETSLLRSHQNHPQKRRLIPLPLLHPLLKRLPGLQQQKPPKE